MEQAAAIILAIGAFTVLILFIMGLSDAQQYGHVFILAVILCLQVPAFFYLHNLSWKREAVREGVARWETKTLPNGNVETTFVWDTKEK